MAEQERVTSLSAHPTAAAGIRRAKARGGLAGFALVAGLGFLHGGPLAGVLWRAVEGGVVAYLLSWVVAVVVWKRVLVSQAVVAVARRREAIAAQKSEAGE